MNTPMNDKSRIERLERIARVLAVPTEALIDTGEGPSGTAERLQNAARALGVPAETLLASLESCSEATEPDPAESAGDVGDLVAHFGRITDLAQRRLMLRLGRLFGAR